MSIVIALSIVLVLVTTALHLLFFGAVSASARPIARVFDMRFYALMLGIFALHLVDIALYAAAFHVASDLLDLGTLEGSRADGVLGHFYASAVIYTTLGYGDVLPNEHLRCLAATEALNGLLFIAWSASFMFAAMGRMSIGTRSHDSARDTRDAIGGSAV